MPHQKSPLPNSGSAARSPAPHVQAALARTAQAKFPAAGTPVIQRSEEKRPTPTECSIAKNVLSSGATEIPVKLNKAAALQRVTKEWALRTWQE